jgi:hypothetical protein
MAEIIMSQVKNLEEAALRQVAMRVVKTFTLAAEKAVAHHRDPQTYPMPANRESFEGIFLTRFRELPDSRRNTVIARVLPRVEAPQDVRDRLYGDLARVDLRSANEIRQQVEGLQFPEALRSTLPNLTRLVLSPVEMVHSSSFVLPPPPQNNRNLIRH